MKNILVINALNGVFPLVLQKKYPTAKITCAEIFPFYKHHLRNLGFEVVDWDDVVDMKFDVIVGNPPYQSMDSSLNLWPLFLEKGIDLLHDKGHIALVTPATWMRPSNDIKRTIGEGGSKQVFKDFMQTYNTKVVDTGYAKRFFDVGSTITWYVIQKDLPGGHTQITDVSGNKTTVNLRDFKLFPLNAQVDTIQIFAKLQKPGDKFKFKGVRGPGKEDLEFKHEPTPQYKHLYVGSRHNQKDFNPKLGCVVYYTRNVHPDMHLPKIIVNYIGDIHPYVDDGNAGMQYCQVHFLDNKKQCRGATSIVKSKLWRFAYKFVRYGMHNEAGVLNSFGIPDLNKIYTDQELYDFYGLTQAEIAMIERSF
jgi:hypothetical protein